MNFNKTRLSRLAGLLTEDVQREGDSGAKCEACNESGINTKCKGCKEKSEALEIAEGYDLRKIIRDEIVRALQSRDESTLRYSSGQVFGKTSSAIETVTMSFPGIGFKR